MKFRRVYSRRRGSAIDRRVVFSGQGARRPHLSVRRTGRPHRRNRRKLGKGRLQNGEASRFLPGRNLLACRSPAIRRSPCKEERAPEASRSALQSEPPHEQQVTGLPQARGPSLLRQPGPILPDSAGSGFRLPPGPCPSGLSGSAAPKGRWQRDIGACTVTDRARYLAIAFAAELAPPRLPGPARDRGCNRLAAPMAGTRSRSAVSSRAQRSRSEGSGSHSRAGRERLLKVALARIAEHPRPQPRTPKCPRFLRSSHKKTPGYGGSRDRKFARRGVPMTFLSSALLPPGAGLNATSRGLFEALGVRNPAGRPS